MLRRLVTPSIADVLFAALFAWLVFFTIGGGDTGLLIDANLGVQIRLGDWIREHGAVPVTDPFSFTLPGQPFFAWEWLSDVFFSVLHEAAGLKALVVWGAAMVAASCVIALRTMAARGANALMALLVLHVGIGAGSVHYLARPHLFTLVFFAVALLLIERGGRRVWLLIPLAALWTNLHGGFVALLVTLGVLTVGHAAEAVLFIERRREGRKQAVRFAVLLAGCAAASVVNPYGLGLHAHVLTYLSQEWLKKIVHEFYSPDFHSTNGRYLELLMAAGLAAAFWLVSRKRIAEALLIAAWTHATLSSARHAPLLALVAMPAIAAAAGALVDRAAARGGRKSIASLVVDVGRDHRKGLGRSSAWVLAAVAAVWFAPLPFPQDFPGSRYPVELVARHADRIAGARVFPLDTWGDYLIYRNYPKQRVFVDGRSDFYGEQHMKDFLAVFEGRPGWDAILDRERVEVLLVPSISATASLARLSAGWEIVEDDGFAMLAVRR